MCTCPTARVCTRDGRLLERTQSCKTVYETRSITVLLCDTDRLVERLQRLDGVSESRSSRREAQERVLELLRAAMSERVRYIWGFPGAKDEGIRDNGVARIVAIVPLARFVERIEVSVQ